MKSNLTGKTQSEQSVASSAIEESRLAGSWAASTSFTQDTRKAAGRATPDAGRDMLVPDSLVLSANLSLVNWTSGATRLSSQIPCWGIYPKGTKIKRNKKLHIERCLQRCYL